MSAHEYNEAGERTAPNGRIWTREMDSFMLLELTVQRQRLAAMSDDEVRAELASQGGTAAGQIEQYIPRDQIVPLLAGRAALAAIDEKFGRRYADAG